MGSLISVDKIHLVVVQLQMEVLLLEVVIPLAEVLHIILTLIMMEVLLSMKNRLLVEAILLVQILHLIVIQPRMKVLL